ncbi:extracellular solute-binding protein [Rhodococcus rhodochrous]|uniref:extracellular solute-binding protein n=1 Tax=Rhodococcus rhodochrous TaxID=1829 RepID=UPI0012FDF1CF|nr:extracellular solute-binding protein [Rhodococcus rhodochrous]MDO1484636.1 extracellular solute-binding protein [Rhodococcus rhodochrous]
MKSRRIRPGRLAAVLAMTSVLAACSAANEATLGDGFTDITERARDEAPLVVYSSATDAVNEAITSAFGQAYPDIEVAVTRLSTGDLRSRFASETATGAQSADLVIVTDPLMFNENPEWFRELSENEVPNLAHLRDTSVAANHFTAVTSPWVITYNEQKIGTPPTTWKDLVSPELAGKASFADPRVSADSVMSFYQILMDENGPDFLRTIGDQSGDWFESSVPAVQKVAAGQLALAAPGAKAHSVALMEAGAPIKAVTPEPVIAFPNLIGISENGQSPNAAMVFADFVLSEEGQRAYCGDAFYMTMRDDEIDGCPSAPEDIRLADPMRAHAEREEILNAFELN